METACRHAESDPNVDSVGFGGLPDRDGRMSFDGCVMLDATHCGSVCFLRRSIHAVSVARRVMEQTNHVMLAGDGADAFAEACGIPEDATLAPSAA